MPEGGILARDRHRERLLVDGAEERAAEGGVVERRQELVHPELAGEPELVEDDGAD